MTDRRRWTCATCGFQRESTEPPARCEVCDDERQFGPRTPRWLSTDELRASYRNRVSREEDGVFAVATDPQLGIGQRAFLIVTQAGNVLWDCVNVVDEDTVADVSALGGIDSIALSHPHFYGAVRDWSRSFSDATAYVHSLDRRWLGPDTTAFELWAGRETKLTPDITLIHCGGHFPGSAVLHWSRPDGRGVLFTGDTVQVCPDARSVSFMYSYPNYIPLGEVAVREILDRILLFRFDTIYGAFATIESDGEDAVRRSAARYLAFLRNERP